MKELFMGNCFLKFMVYLTCLRSVPVQRNLPPASYRDKQSLLHLSRNEHLVGTMKQHERYFFFSLNYLG